MSSEKFPELTYNKAGAERVLKNPHFTGFKEKIEEALAFREVSIDPSKKGVYIKPAGYTRKKNVHSSAQGDPWDHPYNTFSCILEKFNIPYSPPKEGYIVDKDGILMPFKPFIDMAKVYFSGIAREITSVPARRSSSFSGSTQNVTLGENKNPPESPQVESARDASSQGNSPRVESNTSGLPSTGQLEPDITIEEKNPIVQPVGGKNCKGFLEAIQKSLAYRPVNITLEDNNIYIKPFGYTRKEGLYEKATKTECDHPHITLLCILRGLGLEDKLPKEITVGRGGFVIELELFNKMMDSFIKQPAKVPVRPSLPIRTRETPLASGSGFWESKSEPSSPVGPTAVFTRPAILDTLSLWSTTPTTSQSSQPPLLLSDVIKRRSSSMSEDVANVTASAQPSLSLPPLSPPISSPSSSQMDVSVTPLKPREIGGPS